MSKKFNTLMLRHEFPLSSKYDPQWIIENQMGLNALWLTEWLCQKMEIHPGMRVLDLGCGKGLSSIFLAKEYAVQVWATDLWIDVTDNLKRVREAKVSDLVFPIHADAHDLPFAKEFFDIILCVDAYIYFGTDDLYLNYLHKFVKPGGMIGITVPGFMQEVHDSIPKHILPFWAQECWSWHTVDWWRKHWGRTGLVNIEVADTLPDGGDLWLQWKKARQLAGDQSTELQSDIQVLEADRGQYMGFVRMIAKRVRVS